MSNQQHLTSPFLDDAEFNEVNFNDSSETVSRQRKPSILKRQGNNVGNGRQSPSVAFNTPKIQFSGSSYQPGDDDNSVRLSEDSLSKTPAMMEAATFERDDSINLGDLGESEDVDLQRNHTVMKRHRWGTQRNKKGKPLGRHKTFKWRSNSIGRNFRQFSTNNDPESDSEDEEAKSAREKFRTVYWNLPLPQEMLNEKGEPVSVYARNKVRTTKYTPLSFVPKNLMLQFKNVANVYFLVLIILGAFSIFGVASPGMAAVPLIVIVILTAFKDALEDSRRTVLDMEVNNQGTHTLEGIYNPNTLSDNVSAWRKFKKANSRLLFKFIHLVKGVSTKEGRAKRREEKLGRGIELSSRRNSLDSFDDAGRTSFQLQDMNNLGSGGSGSSTTAVDNPFEEEDRHDTRVKPFIGKASAKSVGVSFHKDYWKNIKVGDMVKVQNNEEVPADILILATSDADGGCYVETKNLDGETNLKVRQALKCSSTYVKHASDLAKAKFYVESEGPHANMYSYQGNLKYYVNGHADPENMSNEPVTINNLLLRGVTLRNTKWAIGIVLFTGAETKIMLNAGVTPTKRSRMTRELNVVVFLNFVLLFALCLAAGLVNGIYYQSKHNSRQYYEFGTIAGSPAANGIVSFFVAVILYQSLVPISLYISIEIIKTAQAFFIYSDVLMYFAKLDYPCTPKSWNISDDLGQIEYIFSDKTGTLTQNVMEFKKCTINGVSYGRAYTEAYAGIRKRQGIDVEEESSRELKEIAKDKIEMFDQLKSIAKNDQLYIDELTFISKEFVQDLGGAKGDAQKKAAEHFMLALALCHSVITEKSEKQPGRLELKAQSPDEAALVATARDTGFSFIGRTKKGVIIDVQGVEREYQVLNILEFNSTRKRMSAIIKIPPSTPGGEPSALLICKGADSIIYSRLSEDNDEALTDKTAVHLEQYATEGLRTLCIAQRELTWSEYQRWQKAHEAAAASLVDREGKMEEVADSIERELTLLGGTAIEDRLQEGVPDTIALLAKAGIKLWVLTGDKVETAINIGFSCNLLDTEMDLLVVKTEGEDIETVLGEEKMRQLGGDKKKIVESLISKYMIDKFGLTGSQQELDHAKKDHEPPTANIGLVIDGDALKLALSPSCEQNFLLLCKQCKAVLCCRVSPAQKAAVVKLVKDTLDVMTLAIGDGSNDVAMIQAADVGVGIAGEEGRQAVMSSDYGIGQFRFLARLILVHGRWSYKRLSEMIPSFFYKNVIFTLALFWFGIYSNFDGSYLFEYTYLMFYNLAFTSLPIIFMGIFDQDVPDYVSLLVPQLYRTGILRSEWNLQKFWWYMIDGFYQSLISFFFPYFLYYKNGIISSSGLTLDHRYWMGCIVATIAIVSCNLYVLFHQYRWDWLSSLIVALSILVVFAWTGVWSSSTYSGDFYKTGARLYGATAFWACLFIGILICIIPRFSFDFYQKIYKPKDVDIIRECVSRGDFSQYPFNYDPTDPNRVKVSAYTKEHTLEAPVSGPSSPLNAGVAWRDSLNGTGGTRPSFVKRLFGKHNSTRSPYSDRVGFPSSDTVNTEEIPMDFNRGDHIHSPSLTLRSPPSAVIREGAEGEDRLSSLRNSIRHQRQSLEATRRSLDVSRRASLDQYRRDQNATSFEGRTSMDFPELTTAESLISRLSK
ncbi:unnamed protein product [Kuraishia capsulata CBS 1993]|uniref:Phospholipid-transporting ATPase n=1 Tax=Kuraishia capsulata CBS 1993 TaxID=1382522 RepID=W6MXY4_9ASCO|nr:uncharacterized protein KUCA_T00005683001 [Kuraishia capsulata CBS 1993]CDK29690.1 unnamed protein product [Kuraishia capsulata CBS 1993]